jgi:sec-independent protein translocase protein TatA
MRELVIILVVVLLIFGTKKLSSIGSDLGAAVRGFKKAVNEGEDEQSSPPKQLRSEGTDAEFPEAAKKSDVKPDRSA